MVNGFQLMKSLSNLHSTIHETLPDLTIDSLELPYIMAIYKFHKKKYRWISNAFGSIYVNFATLVTIATMALLEEVKQWANTTTNGYKNFLKVDTSIYWIIDSINDFCLNLPQNIYNIYVADITRCFETIPVNGQDTLFEAMEFITSLGIKNFKRKHPRSEPQVWYQTNANGVTIQGSLGIYLPQLWELALHNDRKISNITQMAYYKLLS